MAKHVREKMISGAREMIAQRGPRATSFAEVIQATGTPRGSIYHHFPGGKQELVLAAIDEQEMIFKRALHNVTGDSAADLVACLTQACVAYVAKSGYTAGCPATAMVLTAENPEQVERSGRFFTTVVDLVAQELERRGLSHAEARSYSTLCFAAMGGAITLARASQSAEPFDTVMAELLHHPYLRTADA